MSAGDRVVHRVHITRDLVDHHGLADLVCQRCDRCGQSRRLRLPVGEYVVVCGHNGGRGWRVTAVPEPGEQGRAA